TSCPPGQEVARSRFPSVPPSPSSPTSITFDALVIPCVGPMSATISTRQISVTLSNAAVLLISLDIFLAAAAPALGQPSEEWFTLTRQGADPLLSRHKWRTDHDVGTPSQAADNLSNLLSFGDGDPEPLNPSQNYVVLVGAPRWADIFLLRSGCYGVAFALVPVTPNRDCDLPDSRIVTSPAVDVIGLKTPDPHVSSVSSV